MKFADVFIAPTGTEDSIVNYVPRSCFILFHPEFGEILRIQKDNALWVYWYTTQSTHGLISIEEIGEITVSRLVDAGKLEIDSPI